jgi:hypothetical protein
MKKILFLSIAGLAFLYARSQDDEAIIIKASNKISKSMTPQQVIDSLNAHFPNAQAVKYYKAPQDVINRGWTVSKDDNMGGGQEIEYYTITFKNEDLDYYGLFAADGRLIRSKQENKVDNVPEAVKTSVKALGEQHPGWKVVSKKYYKNLNSKSMEEYYEIIAQKGDAKKSLYYKPDGTLMEIKD